MIFFDVTLPKEAANIAFAVVSDINGGVLLSQFEAAATAETFNLYKSQVLLPPQ